MEWNAMGAHASKSHLMVVRRKGAAQVAPVAPIRLTSWDFRGDRVREAEVIDVEDGEVRFFGLWVNTMRLIQPTVGPCSREDVEPASHCRHLKTGNLLIGIRSS